MANEMQTAFALWRICLWQIVIKYKTALREKCSFFRCYSSSEQPAVHEIRHAIDVIIREKKKIKAPVITAPRILVAAKVIPKRITDARIVPKIPIRTVGRILHIHSRVFPRRSNTEYRSNRPNPTTAIPKSTHKNAGVTAIVAEKVRNAVTTPKIMLAITPIPVQLNLQLQLVIFFTSCYNICFFQMGRDEDKMQKKYEP